MQTRGIFACWLLYKTKTPLSWQLVLGVIIADKQQKQWHCFTIYTFYSYQIFGSILWERNPTPLSQLIYVIYIFFGLNKCSFNTETECFDVFVLFSRKLFYLLWEYRIIIIYWIMHRWTRCTISQKYKQFSWTTPANRSV